MKEYINKLKEIETLVELSIGTTMIEEKATDIYEITNDLMSKLKNNNTTSVNSNIIQEKLVSFLKEKKKTDHNNVYNTRLMMLNEFYGWLLEHNN